MTAPTTTKPGKAELAIAQAIKAAMDAGDFQQAVAVAERGTRRFPDFRYPTMVDSKPVPGSGPSFAEVAETLRQKLPTTAPEVVERVDQVQTPASKAAVAKKAAPAARKTAPAKKAAPKAAVKAKSAPAVTVLRLVHDGVTQTAIFGIEKDSPARLTIGSAKRQDALGRDGLGWWFFRDNESFYIPGSQGYAYDVAKVAEAIERLESLTDADGNPLYRVECEISKTGPDGKALPVRMTREQAQEWQLAYDAARNTLSWALAFGHAKCGQCGAADLDEKTGRLGKGADGMPSVDCATCGAFPAPAPAAKVETVVFAAPLALPAAPSDEVKAECPLCHVMVKVVDGKLALHTFNNGACRGRLGKAVVDVVAAPAVAPARVRKSAPAVAVKATERTDVTGLTVTAAFRDDKVSGQAMRDTAHALRQALSSQITYGRTFKGVRVETRRDKVTKQLVMTVVAGVEGADSDALVKKIEQVVALVNKVRPGGSRLAVV